MIQMTRKEKAELLGKQAATEGKTLADNPYKTRQVMSLSNWWIKAFKEASNDPNQ